MAVKVGSFAKTTAAATASQAVTGVGFQPKALILWTAGAPTSHGAWTASHRMSFGITSGSAASQSVSGASLDAAASSNTSRRKAAKALTIVEWGESTVAECDLTSFDADGFTLSWTTNDANGYLIHYIALGGDDITNAKAVAWSKSSGTGSVSVTGVGFQPQCLIHISALATSAAGSEASNALSIGVMDGTNEWSVTVDARDGAAAANTSRWGASTRGMLWGYTTNPSAALKANLTSMDADGFTLTFAENFASTRYHATLCLTGTAFLAGATAMSASSGTQSIATTGVAPDGVLIFTIQSTNDPDGDAIDHATMAWGATDGTTSLACATKDEDALADMDVNSIMYNDRVMVETDNSGQDVVRSATLALDSEGFTLNWSAGGAANYLYWLAIGAVAVASGGGLLMQQHHHGGGL